MLGTYGGLAYKEIEDFESHKDYLNYMYGDTEGFISRNIIRTDSVTNEKSCYWQGLYKKERLIFKNRYFGIDNVYTSMNSFFKQERTVDALKRLNALYIDIDCYKIGLSQEQVLAELEEEYFEKVIPTPTFVINSGRGLYLIWKINEDKNALPRWTSVQNYLFKTCLPFNADSQCLDASRILRVPYSINSKNGSMVSIMRFSNVKYTLHAIINEYDIESYCKYPKSEKQSKYQYGEATERQRQYAAIIAERKGLQLPDFSSYENTFNFIRDNNDITHGEEKKNVIYFVSSHKKPYLEGWCRDLRQLFSMRSGEDCRREYGLFLYRLWLCELTHNYSYALNQTLLFNATLDMPFDEKYVITRTASAEKIIKKGSTYKYSKRKIIDVLNINNEEMGNMEYLCNVPICEKERKKTGNRKAYLRRLEKKGKTIKNEEIKERRIKIDEMIRKGLSKGRICEEIGISPRTYDRDANAINNEDWIENNRETKETERRNDTNTKKTNTESKDSPHSPCFALAPKIKPNNYRRTAKGCSACSGSVQRRKFRMIRECPETEVPDD